MVYITGDISPVIEGLRITGGNATGLDGAPGEGDAGGGVYVFVAMATISDNQVFSNTAFYGGGVCLHSGTGTLSGNLVSTNIGGGVMLFWSDIMLSGNTVSTNTGSGVQLAGSDATLRGNAVFSNTGSGVSMGGSDAALSGNSVFSNTGTGLSMTGTDITLSGDTVVSNMGGGLGMYQSDATLTNSIVADNQISTGGSALRLTASSLRPIHTTIARNHGGDGSGIYVSDWSGNCSSVALTNIILVGHTVAVTVTGGNEVAVDAVLWYGTPITVSQAPTAVVSVRNQHTGDPAFAPDGYHLTGGSAAINRAVDADVAFDIEGDARPDGCFPDLGADELITGAECRRVYLPLVQRHL